jgi:hypothetical protein
VKGRESVVIRSRWGELVTFDCSDPRELGCKDPLNLKRVVPPTQQSSVVIAFLDAVLELASDHPKVYDSLRQGVLETRGAGRELSDDVIEFRDGGIGLEGVVGGWSAGDYFFQLCSLDDAGELKCPDGAEPIRYSWDPKQPARFPARGLSPGVYRLYLCEKTLGIPVRVPGDYADLLITTPSRYSELAENFRRVVDATRGWDSTDATAPVLRRMYLHALARR